MLSSAEAKEKLNELDNWILVEQAGKPNSIQKVYKFSKFLQAILFVERIAEKAESDDHHPDILIQYTKVTITLSTHDAGGITEKDFSLAEKIDECFARFKA